MFLPIDDFNNRPLLTMVKRKFGKGLTLWPLTHLLFDIIHVMLSGAIAVGGREFYVLATSKVI